MHTRQGRNTITSISETPLSSSMSGFITTMFVSPASHASPSSPQYPAKPRPLQPIFTFAQSQSCTNLGMHLPDKAEQSLGDGVSIGTQPGWFDALALAKPQSAYKSPLHKIGEALRAPLAGWSARTPAANVISSDRDFQLPAGEQTPARAVHNYSYKLPPSSRGFPIRGMGQSADTCLLSSFSSNPRTRAPFKPQKSGRGTSSWQLKQYAEATLGSGSLRKAVKLPEGEDKDEWLAVNGEYYFGPYRYILITVVVDFYNQINLLYGSITEFCSPQSCPEMKATDEFEYLWQDSENYKKPTKMAAPEYIEHLMAWVQSNVDNEQMFPSRIGVPFPKTFSALIRNMFKRLYRVYAHIYCHHYPVIIELGLEPHLNTSFKHYVLFIDEHGLANGSKDFWGPLGDLVESMLRSD